MKFLILLLLISSITTNVRSEESTIEIVLNGVIDNQIWDFDVPGFSIETDPIDRYGEAVAHGDFNNDVDRYRRSVNSTDEEKEFDNAALNRAHSDHYNAVNDGNLYQCLRSVRHTGGGMDSNVGGGGFGGGGNHAQCYCRIAGFCFTGDTTSRGMAACISEQ